LISKIILDKINSIMVPTLYTKHLINTVFPGDSVETVSVYLRALVEIVVVTSKGKVIALTSGACLEATSNADVAAGFPGGCC